jgi:predicted RND superfamily exporter protein
MSRHLTLVVVCLFVTFVSVGSAQRVRFLKDVKIIQVNATVVANPDKVKEDFAPTLVEDSL